MGYIPVQDLSAYNVEGLSDREAYKTIRKAAKAANQRLLRIERFVKKNQKKGLSIYTESIPAYNYAEKVTKGRASVRFKINEKMRKAQLLKEYKKVMHFLSLQTSTVQGVTAQRTRQFETAAYQGFEGTYAEFDYEWEKAWTGILTDYFDSDQVMFAAVIGLTDALYEIVNEQMNKALAEGRDITPYYIKGDIAQEFDERYGADFRAWKAARG